MRYGLIIVLVLMGCASKELKVNHSNKLWIAHIENAESKINDDIQVGNCIDEIQNGNLVKVTCKDNKYGTLVLYSK